MTTVAFEVEAPEYAYGTRAEHFAAWCREHIVQSVDRFAGEPLELEPWQLAFLSEALAVDERLAPVWASVALVVPRKNGKTALLAAYALYHLLEDDGQPEILLAASSDKQAGRLFEAVVSYVRRSDYLSSRVHLREYVGEIARVDGGGKILRMAASPGKSHGYNASLVIVDELHAWTTPSLRKVWAAFTTSGGARERTQTFTITTAGEAVEREDSILGRLIDGNERDGEVERAGALTISRNPDAETLVFNYSAQTRDPSDTAAMKLANPASWITVEYLARQARNPELSDAEVLQLHGCVWANTDGAWVDPDAWAELETSEEIPDGSSVVLGVDIALVGDTTAIATAWDRGDGVPVVEAEAWSAIRGVVADHYVEDGRIDLEEIERAIVAKAERYQVQAVVYDPRFFERSALLLEREHGLLMVPLDQASKLPEAAQEFWVGVRDRAFRWRGVSRTLSAHVLATAAEKTDKGWRVRKVKQSKRIDAAVAGMMALFMVGEVGAGGFEWAD